MVSDSLPAKTYHDRLYRLPHRIRYGNSHPPLEGCYQPGSLGTKETLPENLMVEHKVGFTQKLLF
jgi:hypothetical protein